MTRNYKNALAKGKRLIKKYCNDNTLYDVLDIALGTAYEYDLNEEDKLLYINLKKFDKEYNEIIPIEDLLALLK